MFIDSGANITPIRLRNTYSLLNSPTGVIVRQAGRPYWGLVLKAVGKTHYTQNGRDILSDATHMVLLPKGAKYTWECTEPGECLVLDFDVLEDVRELQGFEISDSRFVRSVFSKIARCLSQDTPASRLEGMQQLYGLLAFLAKSASKKYVPADKRQTLSPATDYMIAHYADPDISNDLLAGLCGISTVYFRKTFDAVYGISPIRYLNELRISKAKAILSGDYSSIGQVSESVGYNSVYHFSKMFKTYTGMSPTQYAKKDGT